MTTIPHDPLSMVDFEVEPIFVSISVSGREVEPERKVKFKADGTIHPDYRGWTRWRVEMGRIIAYAPGGGGEQLSSPTVVNTYKKALSAKIGREMME